MGQEELGCHSETSLEVEPHLMSGIVPDDPVALAVAPQPGKSQKGPDVVIVWVENHT